MNYAPKRGERKAHPSHVEPEPPRGRSRSWPAEMLSLVLEYRQINKDFKTASRRAGIIRQVIIGHLEECGDQYDLGHSPSIKLMADDLAALIVHAGEQPGEQA